jgi:phosphoadenosine phosphosulfate reductase
MPTQDDIRAAALAERLAALSLADRLAAIATLRGRIVFTTSLGVEDQALTGAIARSAPEIRARIELATLDTGRLFAETRDLIGATEVTTGLKIARFSPTPAEIAAFVDRFGPDGFYDSVEARHACCAARKLAPLARALSGASYWVTGLRRGQSGARAETPFAAWDAANGVTKINPLADLDIDAIRELAESTGAPINPLHARGYPSIGCEPCTRAVRPGEDERAGRWWWESDARRECGLHVAPVVTIATEARP